MTIQSYNVNQVSDDHWYRYVENTAINVLASKLLGEGGLLMLVYIARAVQMAAYYLQYSHVLNIHLHRTVKYVQQTLFNENHDIIR